MRDFATSDDPAVQAQLDRLAALSLPQGRFGLETIRELLARLGNPQRHIPPTFHVAGTNGKGSTCAYLTAILTAQGYRVHSATKPHLVRYNERIRLAGKLISDARLAEVLKQVLDVGEDLSPSFFEVTTAAMFVAFRDEPADVCVIEVGLGGRFDATNVLETAVSCGVASLGIDHEAFLLREEPGVPQDPLARIAFEKASIAHLGVPLVTQDYPAPAAQAVTDTAAQLGAPLLMRNREWWASSKADTIAYRDAFGELTLPLPALAGTHQADNAALAVAMLRHQSTVAVSPEAIAQGIRSARWPARLQLLGKGPLTSSAHHVSEVWLDGGHNPDAAQAIASHFARTGAKIDVVLGMMANKDAEHFIGLIAPITARLIAVPVPGHESHTPEALRSLAMVAGIEKVGTANDVSAALHYLDHHAASRVLIAGSLYLAGEVLSLNREIPD